MDIVLLASILAPLLGGIALSLIPESRRELSKPAGLALSGAVLALSVWLWAAFDPARSAMQFELRLPWVPGLGTSFHLGIDGLSMPLIFLTALLTVLATIASSKISDRPREYFTMLFLLQAGLIGVFAALDLIVFYLFWEVVLIPMYFLIHIWGGPKRAQAALKFFIYTLVGSVVMLAGILALYLSTGGTTFDMMEIGHAARVLPAAIQVGIFAALAVGLAVKVPMFPLHTWLPAAHVEAPTAVSVLLAGVLLKMGAYGFLRFGPPLLPLGFKAAAPVIAVLAVISIVYGAAVALMQSDLKRLVAYSSVSHMGYVMLGIAAGNAIAINGAIVQMFSHGLIAGLLFLLVGTLYERAHTREIAEFGGIAKAVPVLAGTLVFAAFASLGLPGMSGFIGEFLVVLGSFRVLTTHAVIAALGVMLTAGYLLWMLQRVTFGPLNEERAGMPDMTWREAAAIAPLCVGTLVVGIMPETLVGVVRASTELVVRALGA